MLRHCSRVPWPHCRLAFPEQPNSPRAIGRSVLDLLEGTRRRKRPRYGTTKEGTLLVDAEVRMRFISATRVGQSRSVIAVNFKPTPPLGIRCCTTASALIGPSGTRKSSLALTPTCRG